MAVFFKITGHMKKSLFILLSLLIAFTANGQKRANNCHRNVAFVTETHGRLTNIILEDEKT